jgi:hypothetical protein
LTLDADAPLPALPVGYSACDIRGSLSASRLNTGAFTKAVIHIDTIAVTSRTAGDAGADAAASNSTD